MDYKQKLQKLRSQDQPKSYAQALFHGADYIFEASENNLEQNTQDLNMDKASHKSHTEKDVVMNSLAEYAEKELGKNKEKIQFPGGKILKKAALPENYNTEFLKDTEKLMEEEFQELSFQYLGEESFDTIYSASQWSNPESVKLVIVTDKFLSSPEAQGVLGAFFKPDTAALFEKIIQAMKLEPEEYVVTALREEGENGELADSPAYAQEVISYFQPEVVLSLGAYSLKTLANTSARLSSIHGQVLEKTIQYRNSHDYTFKIFPIFHPEFLVINPNMKRTAWTDIQKCMKMIGKL